MGIRPEHISVRDGSGDGIPGEVVLVESLGADSYINASIEGTESSFVARTEGYDARRPATNVRLFIDPARVFAFHPHTEKRSGGGAQDGGNGRYTATPSAAAAS